MQHAGKGVQVAVTVRIGEGCLIVIATHVRRQVLLGDGHDAAIGGAQHRRRAGEIQAGDTPVEERGEFALVRLAVAVHVQPDTQCSKGRIGGVQLAVVIDVQPLQAVACMGSRRIGVIGQNLVLADDVVAVRIDGEDALVGVDPVGLLDIAVQIDVLADPARVHRSGQFRLEVDRQRGEVLANAVGVLLGHTRCVVGTLPILIVQLLRDTRPVLVNASSARRRQRAMLVHGSQHRLRFPCRHHGAYGMLDEFLG
ncbi:hypothetical protein D9M68_537040 [compost metagenome]